MELDSSLSWLALALTPGLASRLSARLLKRFGSPDAVFRAPLTELEGCRLPAPVAQAVFNKEAFKRAEKELKAAGNIDRCRLVNWTEPEYPQTLLQIYDPPVLPKAGREAGHKRGGRDRGATHTRARRLGKGRKAGGGAKESSPGGLPESLRKKDLRTAQRGGIQTH